MAEDLSAYLKELGIKVAYLHSDTKTLERTEILRDLRLGKYDVLVGINLLREGLDLPEVSLVCILDADKEGFLRSNRSLIQTIGRAARNSNGEVIMYGDKITDSMAYAIEETNRRRKIQDAYNKEHNITPTTIHKEIRDAIRGQEVIDDAASLVKKGKRASKKDKQVMIQELEKQMKDAAKVLDFERAMELRDIIMELQGENRYTFSPLAKKIFKDIDEHHGRAFLVGGIVRDMLIYNRVDYHDVDVEVYGLSVDELEELLANYGNVNSIGKSFGILKLDVLPNFDFALPRTEIKTGESHQDFDVTVNQNLDLKVAASRRDLTINALMYEIKTGKIYDFFMVKKILKKNITNG